MANMHAAKLIAFVAMTALLSTLAASDTESWSDALAKAVEEVEVAG
jgi:hypothetical protein